MFDRAKAIDEAFVKRVKAGDLPHVSANDIATSTLADIFDTQLMNRHLDLMARRTKGQTFYSIGSSGHEGLAALATATRNTDMAFLHYRDAAFCIQRRKAVEGSTALWDMALSFTASSEDPVSGGRHKVLGGLDIMTPPQTSTIASHLPKAVGAAHTLCLGHSILPENAIILCTFGDASSNHSTAQGAINTACWASFQSSPMPILFVCEDNNTGISVPTPQGWIAANYRNRPGLKYFECDGTDIAEALKGSREAVDYVRTRRKPAFLHFKTVRLMGHAGADIEGKYRSLKTIETIEAHDPLLKTATHILRQQIMGIDDVIRSYETMRSRVERVAQTSFTRPKLETAEEIMEPIVSPTGKTVPDMPTEEALAKVGCKGDDRPITLNKMINKTLAEVMVTYPNTLVFGEDVGRKGGVYGVTMDLLKSFGPRRVQDTLLDEQAILGMAIGAAQTGYLPIPEIQFLAYLHNAEDQVRGEAATLSYFSNGQFRNPMVIRIAGLAYQRGFGGHFHNDNSIAVLRDIPGIVVACPSNPADARKMLRESVRLVHEEGRVVVFLEPIALYNSADLHDGDKGWASPYITPQYDDEIRMGDVEQFGNGHELAILTYGNGYYLSRQASMELDDIAHRIIDMRWLNPLPMGDILRCVKGVKNILIVDECRETGSVSEELMTKLMEAGITVPIKRITGHDSFIPLGNPAYAVLPSKDDIVAIAQEMVG